MSSEIRSSDRFPWYRYVLFKICRYFLAAWKTFDKHLKSNCQYKLVIMTQQILFQIGFRTTSSNFRTRSANFRSCSSEPGNTHGSTGAAVSPIRMETQTRSRVPPTLQPRNSTRPSKEVSSKPPKPLKNLWSKKIPGRPSNPRNRMFFRSATVHRPSVRSR